MPYAGRLYETLRFAQGDISERVILSAAKNLTMADYYVYILTNNSSTPVHRRYE